MTRRNMQRKPRTREQLLPLQAFVVRQLSMSHHSVLALFRSGHGTLEHLAELARVVYLSRLMQCAEKPGATDAEPFRAAETVLHQCLTRAKSGADWKLDPGEAAQIAPLLVLRDEQLATWRGHRYHDAWHKVAAAAETEISPLAGSDAPPADPAFFALLVSTLFEDAAQCLA